MMKVYRYDSHCNLVKIENMNKADFVNHVGEFAKHNIGQYNAYLGIFENIGQIKKYMDGLYLIKFHNYDIYVIYTKKSIDNNMSEYMLIPKQIIVGLDENVDIKDYIADVYNNVMSEPLPNDFKFETIMKFMFSQYYCDNNNQNDVEQNDVQIVGEQNDNQNIDEEDEDWDMTPEFPRRGRDRSRRASPNRPRRRSRSPVSPRRCTAQISYRRNASPDRLARSPSPNRPRRCPLPNRSRRNASPKRLSRSPSPDRFDNDTHNGTNQFKTTEKRNPIQLPTKVVKLTNVEYDGENAIMSLQSDKSDTRIEKLLEMYDKKNIERYNNVMEKLDNVNNKIDKLNNFTTSVEVDVNYICKTVKNIEYNINNVVKNLDGKINDLDTSLKDISDSVNKMNKSVDIITNEYLNKINQIKQLTKLD